MPPAALQLVVATLDEITKGRGTGKLSLGILSGIMGSLERSQRFGPGAQLGL